VAQGVDTEFKPHYQRKKERKKERKTERKKFTSNPNLETFTFPWTNAREM
jgi:hypothetical protein